MICLASRHNHYNRNAETHVFLGGELGWAMANLLKNKNGDK